MRVVNTASGDLVSRVPSGFPTRADILHPQTMRQSKSRSSIPEGCETCGQALAEILAASGKSAGPEFALVARYRPVADLASGGIFGHMASIHGPPEKLLCSMSRLFGVARRSGKTSDLYRQYFLTAVESFVVNHGQGYLLLSLLDGGGELGEACTEMLAEAAEKMALSAERVIVVHAGVGSLDGDTLERALAAARSFRRLGFKLAAGARVRKSCCGPRWGRSLS